MWGPPRARARSPDSPRSPFQEDGRSLRVGALQCARRRCEPQEPQEPQEPSRQPRQSRQSQQPPHPQHPQHPQLARREVSLLAKDGPEVAGEAMLASRRARKPGDTAALGQHVQETGNQFGAPVQVGAADTVGGRRIPRRLPKQLEENPVVKEWLNTSGR
jgi:hypothetical protein